MNFIHGQVRSYHFCSLNFPDIPIADGAASRPDTRSQRLLPRLKPAPTVDIAPTGSIEGQRIYSPGVLKEKYKGGDHDYYRGIIAPAP